MTAPQIYCAGPLFNEPEKNEMATIANALESSNYKTFLPHRDGLEYAIVKNNFNNFQITEDEINIVLSRAIFALDVYKVVSSDGLILNMNGRVPDEGAMVEAGIAWANNKKIVIFKNDSRSMINGSDNPLVVGLTNFKVINSYQRIPEEFDILFKNKTHTSRRNEAIPLFKEMVNEGEKISNYLSNKVSIDELCELIIKIFK